MRRTLTALVLASGLTLTACSSDAGDDGADTAGGAGGSASSEAASPSPTETEAADVPAADVRGLALTADDFPAGYNAREVPASSLDQGGDAIGGILARATFKPASCGAFVKSLGGTDLSQAGVTAGSDASAGSTIVAAVAPAEQDLAAQADLAATCKTYTFSVPIPGAGSVRGRAQVEELPAPDVDADETSATQSTASISVLGRRQQVVSTTYAAQLRGVTVVVSSTDAGSGQVDTDVLEQLLDAGVEKVAAY